MQASAHCALLYPSPRIHPPVPWPSKLPKQIGRNCFLAEQIWEKKLQQQNFATKWHICLENMTFECVYLRSKELGVCVAFGPLFYTETKSAQSKYMF